jgi:hypothetical protein
MESASRWLVGSSSSRQGSQRLRQHPARQAQAGRDRGRLRLRGVAAEPEQSFLGVAVAADRRVSAGRVGVGHLLLRVAHRGPHLVEPARRQHPVHGQAGQVAGPRILREVTDGAGPPHRAARRLCLTGQHPRQRGLARPVTPDQADLVARGDLKAGVSEQQPRARAQLQVVRHDHEKPLSVCRPSHSVSNSAQRNPHYGSSTAVRDGTMRAYPLA